MCQLPLPTSGKMVLRYGDKSDSVHGIQLMISLYSLDVSWTGHYLCDFTLYASLAVSRKVVGPQEKPTSVLFMHVPAPEELSTEKVTDMARRIILWGCDGSPWYSPLPFPRRFLSAPPAVGCIHSTFGEVVVMRNACTATGTSQIFTWTSILPVYELSYCVCWKLGMP